MSSNLRSFGMISTTLWQSDKFLKLQDPIERLVYIWLHTSQKTCAGALRVGPAHAYEELDFIKNLEHAEEVFQKLNDVKLIVWFKPYIIIENYLQFNPVKTSRHAIGAFKEVLGLPSCEGKEKLFTALCKQKGTHSLKFWRDKDDEPHEVMHGINSYLETLNGAESLSDDIDMTPLEPPYDPIVTPSGKSKNKTKKDKLEMKTSPTSAVEDGTDESDQVSTEAAQGTEEKHLKGATEAAKSSPLVQKYNH